MKKILKILLIAVLSIIAIIFLIGFIPDNNNIPAGYKGSHVDINGAKIRVYQTGSGPDILFIHGLPGMLEVFNPLEKYLSPTCRLTYYDRPGNGFSSTDNDKYTIDYNADVALELIKKLGLKNVVVVANSYGCSVAMAMALKDSNNLKAIILLGNASMYYKNDVKGSFLGDVLTIPVFGRGAAFIIGKTIGKRVIKKTLDDAIYPNDTSLINDLTITAQKYWLNPKVLVAYAKEKISSPLNRKKQQEEYKNIKIKTIFIHGKKDKLIATKHSIDASKLVNNSELILLDDTGHFPQYGEPEKISAIILKEVK